MEIYLGITLHLRTIICQQLGTVLWHLNSLKKVLSYICVECHSVVRCFVLLSSTDVACDILFAEFHQIGFLHRASQFLS